MKNKNNKEVYLSSRGRRQFRGKGAGSMAGAWLSAWPWRGLAAADPTRLKKIGMPGSSDICYRL